MVFNNGNLGCIKGTCAVLHFCNIMFFKTATTLLLCAGLASAELAVRPTDAGVIVPPQYVIPMSAAEPQRVFGTSKLPTIASGQIIQVQFDMDSKAGNLCDLYFTFPAPEAHNRLGVNLATFQLTGKAMFKAQQLSAAIWPATTTWANRAKRFGNLYEFQMKAYGNTKVATVACPPKGQTIGFEIWTESKTDHGKFIQMHGQGMRDNGIFIRQYTA